MASQSLTFGLVFAILWLLFLMPNLKNAKKALRQSIVRAERNTKVRENIAYMRREFRKLLTDKKLDEAKTLVKNLTQALDKAVKNNVVKANTAARVKSRAMTHLNKLSK